MDSDKLLFAGLQVYEAAKKEIYKNFMESMGTKHRKQRI